MEYALELNFKVSSSVSRIMLGIHTI